MEEIKTSNTFFDLFHNCTKQIYREKLINMIYNSIFLPYNENTSHKYKILIIFYIYYTL